MKKHILTAGIVIVTLVVVFNGCIEEETQYKDGDMRFISTEYIGGKYNTSIVTSEKYSYEGYIQGYQDDPWSIFYDLVYTKNGREYEGGYQPDMKTALDWIKTNTSQNCTILCGWDYGHMVEGYAERNAIATFASLSLYYSIVTFRYWSEERINNHINEAGGWTSNDTIEDIANILTTINISSNETITIIQKYNISYILTTRYDTQIAPHFFNVIGKNPEEYYIFGSEGVATAKGNETLIYQIWKDDFNMPGLNMIFENINYEGVSYPFDVRIFEVDIS